MISYHTFTPGFSFGFWLTPKKPKKVVKKGVRWAEGDERTSIQRRLKNFIF